MSFGRQLSDHGCRPIGANGFTRHHIPPVRRETGSARREVIRPSDFKLAAIQATPVFLDLEKTVDKACGLIEQAAGAGAALAVFPEAFLSAYPVWVWFIPPGRTHPLRELYAELHANSISIPGAEVARLGEYLAQIEGWLNPGLSLIVDPDGKIVAGPVSQEETIIYAEVRPDQLVGPRWQLDVAGHYGRPDVFELRIHRKPRSLAQVVSQPDEGGDEES